MGPGQGFECLEEFGLSYLSVYIISESHRHISSRDPKASQVLSGEQGSIFALRKDSWRDPVPVGCLSGNGGSKTQNQDLESKPRSCPYCAVPLSWGQNNILQCLGAAEMTRSELFLMRYKRNRKKGMGRADLGDENIGIIWGKTKLLWRQGV